MKKLSYLLLLTTLMLTACDKDDQGPGMVDFTDYNLLNALIELGVDTNGDSLMGIAEAERIEILDLVQKGIYDMTGIEAFVNLTWFNCIGNHLTSLDFSNNIALVILIL